MLRHAPVLPVFSKLKLDKLCLFEDRKEIFSVYIDILLIMDCNLTSIMFQTKYVEHFYTSDDEIQIFRTMEFHSQQIV